MRLVVLLTCVSACLAHLDWKPERVHLVDASVDTPNFLFRGNEPLLKNETTGELYWPMAEFKERLREVAMLEGNYTLPEDFYLIDLSLETVITDSVDIRGEKKYYRTATPEFGEYWRYSIIGELSSPTSFSEAHVKAMASNLPKWQLDHLSTRLATVHTALHKKRDKPVVIYFHCERGQDRTGEFCGAYQMQYLGWSWKQTLDYALNVNKYGKMVTASKNAMQWYCNYLKYGKDGDLSRDCSD